MSKFTVVTKRSQSYTKDRAQRYNNRELNYEEEYNEEKQKIINELKIIDKFVVRLCRKFPNEIVATERYNRKYCYLFKYNDDPDKGEIYNDTIDGLDTKYILSGKWIPLARQYFPPKKCQSIENRLVEYITDKKFNNGIDPITDNPYRISVFHYKGSKSIFSNGIICSRDGLRYT
jgi:hypothetical protein